MKTLKYLKSSVLMIFFVALIVSCSKDSDNPASDENLKITGVGDKAFANNSSAKALAWNNMNHVFTSNSGALTYSQNTGINFANGGSGSGGSLPQTGSGVVNVKNKQIPIIFGAYVNYGDYYFDIYLLNQSIQLGEDEYPGLSGIIFEIISPSMQEIIPGDYNTSNSGNPFSIEYSSIGIDTETPDEMIFDVDNGSLKIATNGESYTLQFSGTLEDGSAFSGSYSGSLLMLVEDNDPPPPGSGSVSATIDGNYWNTNLVNGYTDGTYFISISAFTQSGTSFLTLELNYQQVSQGAQLTLTEGGVYSATYSIGEAYYTAIETANVSISSFDGITISGSFDFIGDNFEGGTINVTNGIFQNIPISQE